MFVLERTDQGGGFVAKPGHKASYTHKLVNAQKFRTREEAEANGCPGNEIAQDLERVLDYYRR